MAGPVLPAASTWLTNISISKTVWSLEGYSRYAERRRRLEYDSYVPAYVECVTKTDTSLDFGNYVPHRWHPNEFPGNGYVQPFCDSPLDNETVGENVYLNIINRAKNYVYICTPYLIIDNEMMTALCLAAKSGVDVRLMTPGIPDKKMVFLLTQSYYEQLLEAGVKIYEYQPGFLHAKSFVCDDK